MDMDVRSARCFLMLVEERNFRRAAQRLHIPQPYLSRLIQRLEEGMGVTLLHRGHRRFELTDPGRVFLDASEKLVACAEEGEQRVMAFTTSGCHPMVVAFDQCALAEFAPLFADATLTPRMLLPIAAEDPVHLLQRGDIHLALIRSRSEYGGLNTSLVLSDPHVLAQPEGNAEASNTLVPLAGKQRDLRVILSAGQPSLRSWLIREEIDFPRVVEASSYVEALTLVSLGIGSAIIPASYEKLKVAGVIFHKIAEPLPPSEVVMLWRDGSVPEKLLSGLRDWGK